MTVEHLHLALNHLPFLGAAFALIPLLIGLFTGSRTTLIAGLLIAALAGWTTPLVMYTGEEAYDRYEKGPVAAFLDAKAEHYLEEHEERAEAGAKVMYASAVVATIGLLAAARNARWTRYAAMASVALCLASVAAGVWIAEAGGKIRRPDFRGAGMAATLSETHGDDHDDHD